MTDEHLRRTVERAQTEVLRTRLLRIAEAIYPEWVLKPVLYSTLEHSGTEASLRELDFNVHYLVEKGFLHLEKVKLENDGEQWRVQLTARGIDFLEGRLDEVGLASADLVE